ENFRRGEFAGLDLVAVVPVAAAEALDEVARDGEVARGPLANHVEVFVQQQRTVREELLATAPEVYAVVTRGGDGAPVEAHVDGILDHLDVTHGLAEE